MGNGTSRDHEVHVVVVQSQEGGQMDAKLIRGAYSEAMKKKGSESEPETSRGGCKLVYSGCSEQETAACQLASYVQNTLALTRHILQFSNTYRSTSCIQYLANIPFSLRITYTFLCSIYFISPGDHSSRRKTPPTHLDILKEQEESSAVEPYSADPDQYHAVGGTTPIYQTNGQ